MPAQLMRMSQRPNFFCTSAAIAATDCSDVTSHWQASACRPACSTIFTVCVARRDIGDGDVHAVLGKPLGERLADAVRRAGDDGDFVLVAFGHAFSLSSASS